MINLDRNTAPARKGGGANGSAWRRPPSCRAGQSGLALIAVLLMMLVSLAIGLLSANSSRTELAIAHNQVLELRALAIAEAGIGMAKKQIEAKFAVVNNELALNVGCTCVASQCNYGVGATGSGLAALGILKDMTFASDSVSPRCYRFASFGGAGTNDGYYVRVEDNRDEPIGTADAPLADVDQTIRVTSIGVVGTAERTVVATFTLTPGVPGSNTPGIQARDVIDFGGSAGGQCRALNDGTPGSTYPGADSYTGTYPNLVYGIGAKVETTASTSNIEMGSGQYVYGSEISAGTVSGANADNTLVGGTYTTNAPAESLYPYPSPIAACGPPYSGMSGITLTGGASYDSDKGKLLSGSSGNVTLAPGTYCFGLVTIANTLTITGTTVINVTDKFVASSGSFINNTLYDPTQLTLNSSVVGKDAVSLTGNADAFMQVNAPSGEVVVGGGGNFFGSIVGTEVHFSGGSCFHQNGNAVVGGTPGVVDVLSWHELQN